MSTRNVRNPRPRRFTHTARTLCPKRPLAAVFFGADHLVWHLRFGLYQHHLSLLDYPRAVDYGETPEIARAWTIRNGGNIFTGLEFIATTVPLHPTLLHHQRHIYPVHGASSVHRTAHLNAVLFESAALLIKLVWSQGRTVALLAGGVFIQSHHLDVERACACRQPRADVSALCSGLCIRGLKGELKQNGSGRRWPAAFWQRSPGKR